MNEGKRLIRLGKVKDYRPSGRSDANVVFDIGGGCPTLTTQIAHGNSPLILIEVNKDDDKDEQ